MSSDDVVNVLQEGNGAPVGDSSPGRQTGIGLPMGSSSPDSNPERNVPDDIPFFRFSQPLPKPRPFDGTSTKSFQSFASQFERCALSMWGPNSEGKWTGGLEGLLEGHPLELYNSYINRKMPYEDIIKNLTSIFKGTFDPFGAKKLLQLRDISKKPNESWAVFVSKVNSLLAEINPNATIEDREIRLKESLMSKMDMATAREVIKMSRIKKRLLCERYG